MESSIILGIDNSLDFLNIVIGASDTIIEERCIGNKRVPSAIIAKEVSDILYSNNFTIDNVGHIFVTLGPGSFTGIRVALSFCKGIASGRNIPVQGIPTLDVLASLLSFMEGYYLCPLIDAKKNEVFCSLYLVSCGEIHRIKEYVAIMPEQIGDFVKTPCIFFGTGVGLCEKRLPDMKEGMTIIKDYFKTASGEAIIKEGLKRLTSERNEGSLTPIYGRKSEAEIKFNISLT